MNDAAHPPQGHGMSFKNGERLFSKLMCDKSKNPGSTSKAWQSWLLSIWLVAASVLHLWLSSLSWEQWVLLIDEYVNPCRPAVFSYLDYCSKSLCVVGLKGSVSGSTPQEEEWATINLLHDLSGKTWTDQPDIEWSQPARTGLAEAPRQVVPCLRVSLLFCYCCWRRLQSIISSHFFAFDLINQTRPLRRPGVSSWATCIMRILLHTTYSIQG